MPIVLNEEDGGKVLIVHVSGTLVKTDYKQLAHEFEELVRQHGKLRVLISLADFHGLDAGALWEEIKFDIKHFADYERLAVLGDKKWQQAMTIFFKPFTTAKIRYFDLADISEARKWLSES